MKEVIRFRVDTEFKKAFKKFCNGVSMSKVFRTNMSKVMRKAGVFMDEIATVTGECTQCGHVHENTETEVGPRVKPKKNEKYLLVCLYAKCINCGSTLPYKWKGPGRKEYDKKIRELKQKGIKI